MTTLDAIRDRYDAAEAFGLPAPTAMEVDEVLDGETMGNEYRKVKDAGGTAFPLASPIYRNNEEAVSPQAGMTLRDYFAAAAMQAFLSNPEAIQIIQRDMQAAAIEDERQAVTMNRVLAKRSYMLADAMLAERNK